MLKVALAGAQDTGKTTVAKMLSGELTNRGIKAYYVQEFARDYIPNAGSIDSLAEELYLIEQQVNRELMATPAGVQVMLTDSPVFLAYVYSTLMVDAGKLGKKDAYVLSRIYEKVLGHGGYDLVFLLPVLWQPADDGVRPAKLRNINGMIDLRIRAFLDLHGVDTVAMRSAQDSRKAIFNHYTEIAIQSVLYAMSKQLNR